MIAYFKKIIEKYVTDSQYKKNVLIMIIGRIVAQAIPILATPILTRIYSPEEFGIFAVSMAVLTIVSMISNGRYCKAVNLPKNKKDGLKLFLLASLFTILSTCIFGLFLVFWGKNFWRLLNAGEIEKYYLWVVLNVLFVGLSESLFYYGLRLKKFKVLVRNAVLQSLVTVFVRIVIGLLGYTGNGLLISYLLGYALSYFFLFIELRILNVLRDIKIKGSRFIFLIKKYSNFPKFSLLANTLYRFAYDLPSVMLNMFFGSSPAGFYSISEKVLGSPLWFVTSSVGDVYKQEASERYRVDGNFYPIFIKTARTMFHFGIIPFVLIFISSYYFIPLFLGEAWKPVGGYIRIFSLMYFSHFIVFPISSTIYIINKQNYAILFELFKSLSILIAFFVGIVRNDIDLSLILWSGLITLVNIVQFLFLKRFAKSSKYEESYK